MDDFCQVGRIQSVAPPIRLAGTRMRELTDEHAVSIQPGFAQVRRVAVRRREGGSGPAGRGAALEDKDCRLEDFQGGAQVLAAIGQHGLGGAPLAGAWGTGETEKAVYQGKSIEDVKRSAGLGVYPFAGGVVAESLSEDHPQR